MGGDQGDVLERTLTMVVGPHNAVVRKLGSVFHGAANGNRTRNTGTTSPCDNRFTIAAILNMQSAKCGLPAIAL